MIESDLPAGSKRGDGAERERQIRERESVLTQVLQTEEARWLDLMTRLEQSFKR